MTTLFVILIILASVVLGLIVLVQNPKGGGLAGNIAGFSNQFMGVKQTTDVLEKGTWIFAGVIAVLCLLSVLFISKSGPSSGPDRTKDATGASVPATQPQPNNQNTLQLNPQTSPVTPDSTK
ncbi:MAG: preprotein translocase subunit SecG [Chitinophagaceae bacterium]|nr:preprotein translocase subunit SecG [Chitinophagaceae bacterium]